MLMLCISGHTSYLAKPRLSSPPPPPTPQSIFVLKIQIKLVEVFFNAFFYKPPPETPTSTINRQLCV